MNKVTPGIAALVFFSFARNCHYVKNQERVGDYYIGSATT
jgi:hypothetical protein